MYYNYMYYYYYYYYHTDCLLTDCTVINYTPTHHLLTVYASHMISFYLYMFVFIFTGTFQTPYFTRTGPSVGGSGIIGPLLLLSCVAVFIFITKWGSTVNIVILQTMNLVILEIALCCYVGCIHTHSIPLCVESIHRMWRTLSLLLLSHP